MDGKGRNKPKSGKTPDIPGVLPSNSKRKMEKQEWQS
jgi:hypothetical protein